ncbi:RDD family protein [Candidatus Bealeia paramacronuclearis]|uniref:RDD family protein n=1 Tax=Candidatus Bealeia paramacronuclearis TaxID=1921001 RepID=A0ABZ2C8D6_9PROT|nr:RDD family protein [Candidatus Bealeia paramacronuclearis]
MPYAGFWRRVLAFLIDMIIFAGGIFLFSIPQLMSQILMHTRQGMSFVEAWSNVLEEVEYLMSAMFLEESFNPQMFTFGMMWITIFTILISLLESSKWQASPGKKVVGLKVCDINGEQLDFSQSFLRNFNKVFSMIILDLGFILAGLTRRRQALHDLMAHCLVMKSGTKK